MFYSSKRFTALDSISNIFNTVGESGREGEWEGREEEGGREGGREGEGGRGGREGGREGERDYLQIHTMYH